MSGSNVSATGPYGTVSIGTGAALILAAASKRRSVVVKNNHATNKLYVGSDSSVTTSNGLPLLPDESVAFDDYNGDIYGIASASSTDVRYFAVGA